MSARFLRRRLALLAVLLLPGLMYLAAVEGIASLYADEVRHSLEAWEGGNQRFDLAQWEDRRQHLQTALRLKPKQPDYLEMMGRLHYLHALRVNTLGSRVLESYRQALEFYLRAVRQRPVSGPAWSNIAGLKYLLREYDAVFFTALDRAARLEPWDAAVQEVVLSTGLATWNKLPAPTQDQVLDTAVRALQLQPDTVLPVIQAYRQQAAVCALAAHQSLALPECREP